ERGRSLLRRREAGLGAAEDAERGVDVDVLDGGEAALELVEACERGAVEGVGGFEEEHGVLAAAEGADELALGDGGGVARDDEPIDRVVLRDARREPCARAEEHRIDRHHPPPAGDDVAEHAREALSDGLHGESASLQGRGGYFSTVTRLEYS